MKSLNHLLSELEQSYKSKSEQITREYEKGVQDCRFGIYDKYYRYNSEDDGFAYDCGWYNQNQETKNEKVTFI